MEESIRSVCNSMASFCNHLQSSCDALKTSMDRRPIPLGTASSTFIQSLNRRVSAASTQLNLLETMSFETVSFEELLGHCNEVYKDNHTRLLHLQHRLSPFGFVPEIEIDDDDVSTPLPPEDELDPPDDDDDDSLLDESLSLKKLGLSDASLATLAFQANARNEDQDVSFPSSLSYDPSKESSGASGDGSLSDFGEVEDKEMIALAPLQLVKVSRDDYESLPSYMKSLAPWELTWASMRNNVMEGIDDCRSDMILDDAPCSIDLFAIAALEVSLMLSYDSITGLSGPARCCGEDQFRPETESKGK